MPDLVKNKIAEYKLSKFLDIFLYETKESNKDVTTYCKCTLLRDWDDLKKDSKVDWLMVDINLTSENKSGGDWYREKSE